MSFPITRFGSFVILGLFLVLLAVAGEKAMRTHKLTQTPSLTERRERSLPPKRQSLNTEEKRVILMKGTERAFTGKYHDHKGKGAYACRQCNAFLFWSRDKFESGCGWPSFDNVIGTAVHEQPDADGRRVEIICAHCGGHLGHVFRGERMTDENTRHCVNSVSLTFIKEEDVKLQRALFAGGCFWGVEYWFEKAPGVVSAVSGYTDGHVENPSYDQVCGGNTGHAEAVEVIYDPTVTNFELLARLFFETHDPTQVNRQGPDVGPQYRSGIYYLDEEQKKTAEKLMVELEKKGLDIATELKPAGKFWSAEAYHQDYYERKGTLPYCHIPTKRF